MTQPRDVLLIQRYAKQAHFCCEPQSSSEEYRRLKQFPSRLWQDYLSALRKSRSSHCAPAGSKNCPHIARQRYRVPDRFCAIQIDIPSFRRFSFDPAASQMPAPENLQELGSHRSCEPDYQEMATPDGSAGEANA